jgi:hypothetical protein
VTYERTSRVDAFRESLERRRGDESVDFIDGFVFSPREFVLNVGRFVDRVPYRSRYDGTRVYYASTRKRPEDYLEAEDYFFRYDHGVTNVHPKSALGRLLFGRVFRSAHLLRLVDRVPILLPKSRPDVTVDLFVPASRLQEYLAWHDRALGHYPLWVVPYRRVRDYEWLSKGFYAGVADTLFIDLAIYGMKQPKGRNVYREIEEELPRVNGLKTLISYNYYRADEFWTIYNRENYLAVKRVTDPEGIFRDLYDKTCHAVRGSHGNSTVESR